MSKITGSALLLAALFSTGAQADDDGLTLQQQRDRIGEEMVRERTGESPAGEGGAGQLVNPQQQSPRSTLNSPARQNQNGQQPGSQSVQRQPSTTTQGAGIQRDSTPQAGSSGGASAPATSGTGGAAISN